MRLDSETIERGLLAGALALALFALALPFILAHKAYQWWIGND